MILPEYSFAKILSPLTQRNAEIQSVSKKYPSINHFSSYVLSKNYIVSIGIKQKFVSLS